MDFCLQTDGRRQRVPCTIFSWSWWHPSSAFLGFLVQNKQISDFLVGGWTASFGSQEDFIFQGSEKKRRELS